MPCALAAALFVLAVSSTPAFAQFDTRRLETLEAQAMRRNGRAFAVSDVQQASGDAWKAEPAALEEAMQKVAARAQR